MFTFTSEMSFARSATFTLVSTSNVSVGTKSGVRSILICSKHWLMSLWTTLKYMSMHQSMQSAFDLAAAHNRIVCIEWSVDDFGAIKSNYWHFHSRHGFKIQIHLGDGERQFVPRLATHSVSCCADHNYCKMLSTYTTVRSIFVQSSLYPPAECFENKVTIKSNECTISVRLNKNWFEVLEFFSNRILGFRIDNWWANWMQPMPNEIAYPMWCKQHALSSFHPNILVWTLECLELL